jgi:histidinol phosphatase-like PHP family hydrolase
MTTTFRHCDFHVHTELSGEKQASGFTLEKLFATADALGLTHVGYSEHWKLSTSPDLFHRIRDEVERLQPKYRVKVFVSAEIDVLNSRGDLACDVKEAEKILDYVSVAISHYDTEGAEQLLPDRVDDTVAMIQAVCRIPAVTMLMHPQIVYGHNIKSIKSEIPADVYAEVMRTIVAANKVVDYPSVRMCECWLSEIGLSDEQLAIERASFGHFTDQLVKNHVRLAPGSDAHNALWHGDSEGWFGNNAKSLALLESYGYSEDQLWYYDNR